MNADTVAHDQLRAFIERVERLDEELKAINDDKKEVFAEAKGNGFDVPAIKAVLKIRRMDHAERMEREALVDLYLAALGMGPGPDEEDDHPSRAHVQVHVHEALPPHDEETGEIIETSSAEPAEAEGAVAASSAHQSRTGADHSGSMTSLAGVEGDADRQPITREGAPAEEGAVPPSASSSDYAAPGVVVMEKCPPKGIVAHPYAACWPVNNVDATGGIREPIVKIEHFILDGRGRYFAARDAGIEYPVVQYQGDDPLLDSIRWNLASRPLADVQRRIIAHKLCAVEPSRADEIMGLFGLEAERQAAE